MLPVAPVGVVHTICLVATAMTLQAGAMYLLSVIIVKQEFSKNNDFSPLRKIMD